jgi:hypothetical protein
LLFANDTLTKLETFWRFQFGSEIQLKMSIWIPDANNQDDRRCVSSHTRFGARWFQARSPGNAPFDGGDAFLNDTIFIVTSSGWIIVLISVLAGTLVLGCGGGCPASLEMEKAFVLYDRGANV